METIVVKEYSLIWCPYLTVPRKAICTMGNFASINYISENFGACN
jgi:hypothetical protein